LEEGTEITTLNITTGESETVVSGATFDKKMDAIQMILAAFGAWVATVIAFYYSSESQKRAQEGILQVLSPEKRLLITKADEVMLSPVFTVTADTTIEKVLYKMSEEGNVVKKKLDKIVVADKDNKPLGVLYNWEIIEHLAEVMDGPREEGQPQTIKEYSEKTNIESAMKKIKINPWTDTAKIRENFVLAKNDTSLASIKEMLTNRKLDYAIVVDDNGVCSGIITMRLILEKLTTFT